VVIIRATMIDLVLVTASLDATAQIYVLRPLDGAIRAGEVRLHVLSQDDPAEAATLMRWLRRRHGPSLEGRAAALFCRYAEPRSATLVEIFRDAGLPTAALLDDDLFDPPPASALHALYAEGGFGDRLRHVLSAVRLLYVPTRTLADRLADRGIATPCFTPDVVLGLAPPAAGPVPAGARVGYMASRSHIADFRIVAAALAELLAVRSNLALELFGGIAEVRMQPPLAAFADRIEILPAVGDHGAFLQALAARAWTIGIAPLADTGFNRCKTAVKWIEYAACGIPVVASDMPVYAGLPALLVGDDGWFAALSGLLDDGAAQASLRAGACAHLAEHHDPERHRGEMRRFLTALGLDLGSQ
jgi:hypothetical protein